MTGRIYRFTEFELIPAEGELRTASTCVRLQDKPLLLLIALLDHPQTLVTREQLRERMWNSDTFVDYEQGINVAVMKVRDALGDSAENSRFIQTVAKRGYRFLLPVAVTDPNFISSPAFAPQAYPTPHVIPPEASNASPSSQPLFRWRPWMSAASAAGVLVLALLGLRLFHTQPQRRPTQIRSLAVLPLRNLSSDSSQDYFADGITEELITSLAQSLPLRVISRTSVMRYKQTSEPIDQIARELGVEAIVEGAVARSGDRVSVTVQLIDATEDRHLWAQRYDRDLRDILGMEAELSQEIAGKVGGTIRARQVIKAVKSRPVDSQVYELCLLGRFHWNKRGAADLARSAQYYQQAINRDPEYAPAYAGLANAYALLPSYDSVDLRENYAKASAAGRRALDLDDTLAEAHATLGLIALNWRPDWMRAEAELHRALELNPNYATAHHWFAFYLLQSDRTSEAVAEIEIARQLDPLSAIINADQGEFLYTARRYDEARLSLRQAIELEPNFGQPHTTLALIELETGHKSDALQEARASLALDPGNPSTMGKAGYVLAAYGQTAEATKLLATLNDMVGRGSAFPIYPALIDMGLRQRHEALEIIHEPWKWRDTFSLPLGKQPNSTSFWPR